MKRLLLAFLALTWASAASAQCVGVGGINSVPQVGVSCLSEPTAPSYAATGTGIALVAAATDVACITGSATKIVRLQGIRVSGTATPTALSTAVLLTKHASADTLGTPAVTTALPTPYSLDTANPTVSATTTAYTANPTINDAAPGIIDGALLNFGLTTAANAPLHFDYYNRLYAEAPTLRGVAQQVCVNLNAVTVTGGLMTVEFRWTESPQ